MSTGAEINASTLATLCDEKGYLKDWTCWTHAHAHCFAELEGIELTDAHWEILDLLREFYQCFDASPANRALVNFAKRELGPEKGNSIYLMSLFPESPARRGSRIAGLPKPKNCL
jgi:tRNA 2-thiouridine synthesizing protein E